MSFQLFLRRSYIMFSYCIYNKKSTNLIKIGSNIFSKEDIAAS